MSGSVILAEGVIGQILVGWNVLGPRRGLNLFSDPERALNVFHASLANVFNKCYKKGCFREKKTIEFGYI